jgi:hypothetical protein
MQVWLSTAPGMPATHWFQLRCVFQVRSDDIRPAVATASRRNVLVQNSIHSTCLRAAALSATHALQVLMLQIAS